MCQAAKMTRATCQKQFDEIDDLTSDVISQVVKMRAPGFLALDRDFGVELALLGSLTGSVSETRLKNAILNRMPSASRKMLVEESAQQVSALLTSQEFKFLSLIHI
eukprot:2019752-Alexandrium_andersonii.AAC.1